MFSVRLPESLENRLTDLASSNNRSKSFYVKEALSTYIDDLDDAEEAFARLSDPEAKYCDTDELLKSLSHTDV